MIRMITGQIKPTTGAIRIFGSDPGSPPVDGVVHDGEWVTAADADADADAGFDAGFDAGSIDDEYNAGSAASTSTSQPSACSRLPNCSERMPPDRANGGK